MKGKKRDCASLVPAKGINVTFKIRKLITEISAQELLTLLYTEYSPCKETEDNSPLDASDFLARFIPI